MPDDGLNPNPKARDVEALRDQMRELWLLGILDEERIRLAARGSTGLLRAALATLEAELPPRNKDLADAEQQYRKAFDRFADWMRRELHDNGWLELGDYGESDFRPQVGGPPSRLTDIEFDFDRIGGGWLLSARSTWLLERAQKKAAPLLAAYDRVRDARAAVDANRSEGEAVRGALASLVDRDLREQEPPTSLSRTVPFGLTIEWHGRRWVRLLDAPAIPPVGTVITLQGSTTVVVTAVTLTESRTYLIDGELSATAPEHPDPMGALGFNEIPPDPE